MNDRQKEAIDFYLRNDYLIVNSIMWNNYKDLDKKIEAIVNCNNAKIKEALEIGIQKYWNADLVKAQKQLEIFKNRAYDKIDDKVKQEILKRAKEDINLILSAMLPIKENLILYRNVDEKFATKAIENFTEKMLGFSSCSTEKHIPHDKMYGSENCVTYKISVPKGFLALRLDQMPDLCNEPDEVILPPMKFKIDKIEEKAGRKLIAITALEMLKLKQKT